MIGFDELNETKKELKEVNEVVEESNKLTSACDYARTINGKFLPSINRLIGKSLNQSVKANVQTLEFPDEDNNERKIKYTLEISRKGIGATSQNRYQIEVYEKLFNENDRYGNYTKGFMIDVIDDENVFNKTLEYLNPKGKEIMKVIREVRQKTNVGIPQPTQIHKSFKFSNGEKEFFSLGSNEGLIEILDDDGNVEFEVSGIKEKQGIEKTSLFSIHALNMESEEHFAYLLFVKKHKKDFDDAIIEYKKETKEKKESWEKFDEMMKERLAKFILLERI
jgi:hypothetical protein